MTNAVPDPNGKGTRLDSWKAIADYLGLEVRSVQRWESERGLPVHRVPGEKRGRVFAFTSELDAWLRSGQQGTPLLPQSPGVPPGEPPVSASFRRAHANAREGPAS